MKDEELLRYSRQIMLPQVDIDGQQKLIDSTVLIVGMGGLGSPSAFYLAAAGIGHLILADFDRVELSNLQRQIIHSTPDVGKDKVDSAKETLVALNPEINVTTIKELTEENLATHVSQADVVLDGTDNFKSRFAINKTCVEAETPLVSAAVIRFEGQLSVFKGYEINQPCYQCLYSEEGDGAENCVENGILAPVAGVLGTMQALQAIKVLLSLGEQLCGELMLVDALDLSFRRVGIAKDSQCPICN